MPTARVQAKEKRKQASRAEPTQPRSGEPSRHIVVGDLRNAINYLDDDNVHQIQRAYRFSKEAHAGQERKSGEAYIPVSYTHLTLPTILLV